MNIYDFKVKTIDGQERSLEDFRGKVLLIVNTASQCGFTPQYEGLQKLYQKYHDRGFKVLGFPSNQFEQEPASNSEIQQFCSVNFGVSFPMFAKVDVRGEKAHPLFKYLSSAVPFKGLDMKHPIGPKLAEILQNDAEYLENKDIKWNFTKFLIDREGNVVDRFEPTTEPEAIAPVIEKYL